MIAEAIMRRGMSVEARRAERVRRKSLIPIVNSDDQERIAQLSDLNASEAKKEAKMVQKMKKKDKPQPRERGQISNFIRARQENVLERVPRVCVLFR